MASHPPPSVNDSAPPQNGSDEQFRIAMAAVGLTEENLSLALSIDLASVRKWCDGTVLPPNEVAEALRHLVEVQNRFRPP
jgi:ribosome-binding protein aMBF1 (putative translation factor)